MKVAFSIADDAAGVVLDPRFGRARRFWIVDTETSAESHLDNGAAAAAAHGAGLGAVQALARAGVRAVVTGNVGTKSFAALRAAGIRVHLAPGGPAAEALRAFGAGALPEFGGTDGGAHGAPVD